MSHLFLRRTALVGSALAILALQPAIAAPAVPPAVGYYEASNARWARAPGGIGAHGEALHFSPTSHPVDQPYMSTSFFPAVPMQMDDLKQLQIELYVPLGQTCQGGKADAWIVMEDSGGSPRYVFGVLGNPSACTINGWRTLDFIADATWGGGTLAQADAAAKADPGLGPDYQIRSIRVSYTVTSNTEAWFDLQKTNSLPMAERVNDMSPNALLPDQEAGPLPMTLGYFQTRNIRWGRSPSGALHGEAMHFSPWSHSTAPDDNFMSTSFFPQNVIAIRDLKTMGVNMYLPAGSNCAVGEYLSPYMWLVLNDAGDTETFDLFVDRTDMATLCANKDRWQQLDFVNGPNVRWRLRARDGSVNLTGSREAVHSAAVAGLGLGYRIDVIRLNFFGNNEAWFDQQNINGMLLLERLQDFTSDALLLDTPLLPDGVVPYFP